MSCPNCKAPDASLAGLRYDCGSYFTWGGLSTTSLCREGARIYKEIELLKTAQKAEYKAYCREIKK